MFLDLVMRNKEPEWDSYMLGMVKGNKMAVFFEVKSLV